MFECISRTIKVIDYNNNAQWKPVIKIFVSSSVNYRNTLQVRDDQQSWASVACGGVVTGEGHNGQKQVAGHCKKYGLYTRFGSDPETTKRNGIHKR